MNNVHWDITRALLKPCPFCGSEPNMFQVPENRYGETAKWGWFVQCSNMGCYAYKSEQPNMGDQSFMHAVEDWNKRV